MKTNSVILGLVLGAMISVTTADSHDNQEPNSGPVIKRLTQPLLVPRPPTESMTTAADRTSSNERQRRSVEDSLQTQQERQRVQPNSGPIIKRLTQPLLVVPRPPIESITSPADRTSSNERQRRSVKDSIQTQQERRRKQPKPGPIIKPLTQPLLASRPPKPMPRVYESTNHH